MLECRAYQPPPASARAMLLGMGNTLDGDLVREFAFSSKLHFDAEA